MAISYMWEINPLECYPTSSSEIDVVFIAHWQLLATEVVDDKTYTASTRGATSIPMHSGDEFVPFNDLTLELVQGWVEESLGPEEVQSYKDDLANQIQNQINPPVITLQSPWLTNSNITVK